MSVTKNTSDESIDTDIICFRIDFSMSISSSICLSVGKSYHRYYMEIIICTRITI